MQHTRYCATDILEPYLPVTDEAEFEQSEMATEDMVPEITNSPDDGCFEREVDLYPPDAQTGIRYVEAYGFAIDLDDGIDIDETGLEKGKRTELVVQMNGPTARALTKR